MEDILHLSKSQTNANKMISVFSSYKEAELVKMKMEQAGFDMKKISLQGKDYQTDEQVVEFYKMGKSNMSWGASELIWTKLWELIFGSMIFVIPKESIKAYEAALRSDKITLIVHGSIKELMNAREIVRNLNFNNIVDFELQN